MDRQTEKIFLKHQLCDGILPFRASCHRGITHQGRLLLYQLILYIGLMLKGHQLHAVKFRNPDIALKGFCFDDFRCDTVHIIVTGVFKIIYKIPGTVIWTVFHLMGSELNKIVQIGIHHVRIFSVQKPDQRIRRPVPSGEQNLREPSEPLIICRNALHQIVLIEFHIGGASRCEAGGCHGPIQILRIHHGTNCNRSHKMLRPITHLRKTRPIIGLLPFHPIRHLTGTAKNPFKAIISIAYKVSDMF